MPVERAPLALRAGEIELADWPGDAVLKQPNKRRLARDRPRRNRRRA